MIIEELGRGGMAVVYLAEETTSPGRKVALKVLLPEAAERLDVLQRFRREAALYEKLKHPRIIHSQGLEVTDGIYYLILDYMEGGSLAQRIKEEGRIPWDEAVRITRQVAEALAYAHASGIVHRDVKPSNILFDGFGDAYLADFGIAHDAEAVTITQVGIQPGTYHYMAPEQIQGKKIDHRTDQFSLATVFYQMICGYLPFSAGDTFALAHQIVNEPPALLPPDLDAPHGVATILNRAHAKDPNDRYPDIMAFVNALERLSLGEPVSVVPPPIPRTKLHQPRRPIGPMLMKLGGLGMAGMIIVVILIAGFHYLPRIFASSKPQRSRPVRITLAPPSKTPGNEQKMEMPANQNANAPGGLVTIIVEDAPTPTPTDTPTTRVQSQKSPMPTLIRSFPTPRRKRETAPTPEKPTPPPQRHTERRVTLLSPQDGETLQGRVTFSWRADFTLAPNEAFELAFWHPSQDPMRDARSPVEAGKAPHQTVNMPGVYFIRESADWYWGVFLFDQNAQKRIKLISPKRHFIYHGN